MKMHVLAIGEKMTTVGVPHSRLRFALGSSAALATIGIARGKARAAQFQFKCASQYADDHPTSIRLREMWANVEQQSGGRIHTDFFPNSVLGGDAAMFAQLRVGALHFLLTGSALSSVVPGNDISAIGFAFKDADEAWHATDGALGNYIHDETEAKGIHLLRTSWDAGIRQIAAASRPIRTPDDFASFKVKVLGKINIDLFKELGAIPIELPLAETYTGFQTKLIDGSDNPLQSIWTSKFYEVIKYISVTNHGWSGLWVIANVDAWRALPTDLQDIVARNNTKFAKLERQDNKRITAQLTDKLMRQGVTFNRVDQAPFRARLRQYYASWANTFGPAAWTALQTSLGRSLT